jgi:hypothetical protein
MIFPQNDVINVPRYARGGKSKFPQPARIVSKKSDTRNHTPKHAPQNIPKKTFHCLAALFRV